MLLETYASKSVKVSCYSTLIVSKSRAVSDIPQVRGLIRLQEIVSKKLSKPGMREHTSNPSTQKDEAGGPRVQGYTMK